MAVRMCEIEGCVREHSARGYCRAHYTEFTRSGKLIKNKRIKVFGTPGSEIRSDTLAEPIIDPQKPRKKKTFKSLTPDDIMEVIKMFVMLENREEVARRTGITNQVIYRVLKDHTEIIERLKKNRDEILEHDLTKLIEMGVTRLKNTISTSSPKDAVIILGTCYDKRQLIRGGPTQVVSIDDEKALSKRLSQRLGLLLIPSEDRVQVSANE